MANNGIVNYETVTIVPGEFIVNRAYTASNQVEYFGYAERGVANSDPHWTIRKYTYTANLVTAERVAKNLAWDDRVTGSYS